MKDTQNKLNNSLVWKHNAHFFPKDSENIKIVSCLKETYRESGTETKWPVSVFTVTECVLLVPICEDSICRWSFIRLIDVGAPGASCGA